MGAAMVELPCEADIHCDAETIFDLIVDFRGQDRWLTRSSAFHGTDDISSDAVALGTTYREPGPFGDRNGKVTEFQRPTKVTFHQPMTMKFHLGTHPARAQGLRGQACQALDLMSSNHRRTQG